VQIKGVENLAHSVFIFSKFVLSQAHSRLLPSSLRHSTYRSSENSRLAERPQWLFRVWKFENDWRREPVRQHCQPSHWWH